MALNPISAIPGMGAIGALGNVAMKAKQAAGGTKSYTPKSQAPAPRQQAPRGGAGGGGGTYSGGSLSPSPSGQMVAAAAPPPRPSLEDWRAGDSVYNSSVGSIDNDLNGLMAQLAESNRQYNADQDLGLRNMGWDATAAGGQGDWNADDQLGAYGQSRSNLFNDFSGRGMLDSSFFADKQTQMTDNFNRQRMDMNEARTGINNEYNASRGRAQNDANLARQQAMADAAARYAAQFGA